MGFPPSYQNVPTRGDGSVSKVFAAQAVGSELNIEDPYSKRPRRSGVYSQFSVEETEMGKFLGDNSKLAYLGIQTSEKA